MQTMNMTADDMYLLTPATGKKLIKIFIRNGNNKLYKINANNWIITLIKS